MSIVNADCHSAEITSASPSMTFRSEIPADLRQIDAFDVPTGSPLRHGPTLHRRRISGIPGFYQQDLRIHTIWRTEIIIRPCEIIRLWPTAWTLPGWKNNVPVLPPLRGSHRPRRPAPAGGFSDRTGIVAAHRRVGRRTL